MAIEIGNSLRRAARALGPRRGRGATGAIAFAAAAMALLPAGGARATNGIELIGTSVQSRSRGGVDVAVGDTALSAVSNPATLSLQEAPRLDAAAKLALLDVTWHGPIDSSDSDTRAIFIGDLGLARPAGRRFAWGVAVHSRAGIGSNYEARHLLMPWSPRRVGSDLKVVSAPLNVSYRLTEKLSVGGGIRAEIATARFSTVFGPIDYEFDRGYATGGGFQLGLHYRARTDLAFGVAYHSPTWFGDLEARDSDASALGLPGIDLGRAAIDEFRLPQRIAAGVAWDTTERLKLIGEVRWINYSNSTFSSLTIATDGAVDLRIPLDLGYRDQWVFIAGAEYRLDEHWTAAVGYNYGRNPVSRPHLLPIASVISEHHITTSLRYARDDWWIGAGYILSLPASLEGSGRSAAP